MLTCISQLKPTGSSNIGLVSALLHKGVNKARAHRLQASLNIECISGRTPDRNRGDVALPGTEEPNVEDGEAPREATAGGSALLQAVLPLVASASRLTRHMDKLREAVNPRSFSAEQRSTSIVCGGAGTELRSMDPLASQTDNKGPLLLVEFCPAWQRLDIARLPELNLGETLARRLHCYAHGGFMGAAISMLADPAWESILLEAVAESNRDDFFIKVPELFLDCRWSCSIYDSCPSR